MLAYLIHLSLLPPASNKSCFKLLGRIRNIVPIIRIARCQKRMFYAFRRHVRKSWLFKLSILCSVDAKTALQTEA